MLEVSIKLVNITEITIFVCKGTSMKFDLRIIFPEAKNFPVFISSKFKLNLQYEYAVKKGNSKRNHCIALAGKNI